MIDSKNTVNSTNANYTSYIRCFASGQYLANLSYYLAKLPQLPHCVEILTQEGSFNAYYLKPLNLKKGLIAYILLPMDKTRKEIKIVFRGTDFEDTKSAVINLEPKGPGTESFSKKKESLFNTLNEVIQDYYGDEKNLSLEVCGHSQGATLSQLFASEFVIRYFKNDAFSNINSLNMIALNSPGIPHKIVHKAHVAAFGIWIMKQNLKITANYGMVGGDAVQVTGEDTVFATLPHFVAQVNLLKVDKDLEGHWLDAFTLYDGLQPIEFWNSALYAVAAMLGAHSSLNYYAPIDANGKINVCDKYDYFTNQHPKEHEVLKKELLNKALLIQRLLHLPKVMLYYLLKLKGKDNAFPCSSILRKMLGLDRITTWYKNFTTWYQGSDKNNPILQMTPQTMIPIEIGEQLCCCPQFLATKERSQGFFEGQQVVFCEQPSAKLIQSINL